MKKQLSLLILFLISGSTVKLYGQETLPEKIQTYFDTYQKEYPVEKAYLHLDKTTYTLGEDLWFSAYLTAGGIQVPSPLSATLYVDLFDGDGVLLEQKIIRMEEGRGSGDFELPPFGKAGVYQLKAYTAWMRNFGEDYFFKGTIHVADGAGGSFLPKITYNSIESRNGEVTYRANLVAIDSEGSPLSGKTIEVKAKAEEEQLYSQKFPLNAQGEVSFTFSIPEKANPDQVLELTYYENGDYGVTQKLQLPYSMRLADIQFLPEGGRWLNGKKAIIAFRAIYPNGMPVSLEGEILGTDIKFASNFGGLGKFEITPDRTDYQAKIKNPATGEEISMNLPKVDSEGFTMQVINNPVASYVTVFVQGTYEQDNLLLISQTRGLINYMIKGALSSGVWGVRIPKENLLAGINHITVMDSKGNALLERLLFIQPTNQIDLEIATTGNLSPREKISINLKTTTSGNPLSGSFSVAVLDADQTNAGLEGAETILSNLLLTSDLKGSVYQPGRYFQNNQAESSEDLDLVMLTHGWTRFGWEDILSSNYPKITQFIEQGINIEGQVTDNANTRKGLTGGKITALVDEGVEMMTTEFGPNGRFLFKDLDYFDDASITITAEDNRIKNFVDIEVIQPERVFSSIHGKYPDNVIWPDALTATYQARNMMNQMINGQKELMDLEEVTVEASTIKDEENQIRKIYGEGDVSINPEKILGTAGFTNVFQLIQGRVAGLQVSVSGQNVSVIIRGISTIGGGDSQPLYILNNIPVDASTLLNVNPNDVSSIDVFKETASTSIFGSQGASGVIAVYTKDGRSSGTSVGGTLVTQYSGYAVPKEFYLPKYDTKTPENSIKDARATIYWNPILKTGENGETSFEFYNSDIAEKQLIVIEGIDSQGRLGRLVRILE